MKRATLAILPRAVPEMRTASELRAIASNELTTLLDAERFVATGTPRRWVRARPPLRDVFEIVPLKGATWVPRWGISLDFVPHLRGDELRWHRTDKSAVVDVVYDLVDFDPDWNAHAGISLFDSLDALRGRARQVLARTVPLALAWFDTFDADSLPERIEHPRAEERKGHRFGFDNWVQQPLALAFSYARAGRPDDARRELARWTTHGDLNPAVVEKLEARLAATAP